MCGIVGLFFPDSSVDPGALERATSALSHRGPDAQRTFLSPDRRVGLGHARLSIIDLSGGDQPIQSEDGTVVAVVNGEVYDFERLRAELESKGHRFRTKSDSEVLVHLYEERGPACVDDLRGELAFVLYDKKNEVLLAGRDRFGIKPLFFARHQGGWAFASEAKALFAAGVPARWDSEMFHLSTMLGGPLEDRSFFAGVEQLPPGHVLRITRDGHRLVRYWDFDYPLEPEPGDEREQVESLRGAVTEAVRLRLRADVPVACYLSGGIDSATILGLASQLSESKLTAFTLAFDRAEYDESSLAEAMAARAGAEFVRVPVGEADFARDFERAVFHAERPLNNANSAAKFRLSRAVREAGIKVVLTGEGADEVFAGYPHYRQDLFRHDAGRDASGAAEAMRTLEGNNAVSRGILLPEGEGLPLGAVERAFGAAPTWLAAFATSGHKMRALWSRDFDAAFGARDPISAFVGSLEVGRQITGRHPVHQSMYSWSKSVLPNFILSVLGDRMEMAHSVEGRVPFLDHHVVELASRLPVGMLIRGTVEKYVLRELARDVVTEAIHTRQKHPFFAPPVSDGPLGELMKDTLRSAAMDAVPFFDRKKIGGLIDGLPNLPPATRVAMDAPLLLLLSCALLQRSFALGS